jgi:CRP-like cAMP-binding protein
MDRRNQWLERLRGIELFSTCTRAQLKRIDSLTTYHRAPAGRVLTREGNRGLEFIVILRGTARTSRGGLPLGQIGPGAFFGELALLDRHETCATVTAETDMDLLVSSVLEFRSMYFSMPVVSKKLLELDRAPGADESLRILPRRGRSSGAWWVRPLAGWPAVGRGVLNQ